MRTQKLPGPVQGATLESWTLADEIAERYERMLDRQAAKRAARRRVSLKQLRFLEE